MVLDLLKGTVAELRGDTSRHKKEKKIMSRIEWIAQIKDIFSYLIVTFNREYFKKETISEMIHAVEAVRLPQQLSPFKL